MAENSKILSKNCENFFCSEGIKYSRVQKSIENWSVCSKMALGEVGPCPSGSRLVKTFFKSHNFFIMEKCQDILG